MAGVAKDLEFSGAIAYGRIVKRHTAKPGH